MRNTFLHSRAVRLATATFFSGVLLGSAAVVTGQSMLGSGQFTDVEYGSYYDAAIGELSSLGIINGYDATHFGPNDPVTRGQVAVLLKRMRDELKGITPATSSSSSSRRTSSSFSSSDARDGVSDAGAIRFASGAYSADENQGTLQIKLIRSIGTAGAVTVNYVIEAGAATAGDDYVSDAGEITFGDGQVERTITVRVLDDAEAEENETFTVRLSSPTGGAVLGSVASSVVTIKDNDTAAAAAAGSSTNTVTFSAVEYMANENMGNLIVRVVRSATGGSMTAGYRTANDVAISPADYTEQNGTVSFAAGESMKEISIPINNDTGREGNEKFTITLSGPTNGAALKNPVTTVVIVDDETVEYGTGSLRLTAEEYRVSEKDTVADVIVERFGGAAGTVSVQYQTAGGTATEGADYKAVNGMLVFLPGESKKVIPITLLPDKIRDDFETIIVILTNPIGTSLETPRQAEVLIVE